MVYFRSATITDRSTIRATARRSAHPLVRLITPLGPSTTCAGRNAL
jgi:hypothetical protein